MLFKNRRRERIAGCPVIDKRQKLFRFEKRGVEIFYVFDKKCVKIVFFKITVRKIFHKIGGLGVFGFKKLFCEFF